MRIHSSSILISVPCALWEMIRELWGQGNPLLLKGDFEQLVSNQLLPLFTPNIGSDFIEQRLLKSGVLQG